MGDILKEAIADAKAVRETALENAKMALEEAFTPQLKSMLSAKLKEEEDDDTEEGMHGDDEAEEGSYSEEEEPAEEGEHGDEAEEGSYDEGEHEAEEGAHDDEAEEGHGDEVEEDDDEDEVEEDLDLEAVIKELEAELSEGEDDEEVDESTEPVEEGEEIEEEFEIDEAALTEEDDDDKDEVDEELDKSSGIGKGDNKEDNTDTTSGIGSGGQEAAKKLGEALAELKEYKEAVGFLKGKLNELNILNAKLLFTNKLFKSFSLDNNQKLKVVETFDRAQTTREIKLVYSTLAEQFTDNSSITRKNITESIASSKSGSTKPSAESKKVISEENNVADRFRKLAGLKK
tara:strand:- start:165 stop:1199 length:1035 start_codon:yes stop_codon:yes gene_type:complete